MQRSTGWESGDADPIRLRLSCVLMCAGWLEQGPVRCSRVRSPGGAVLHCWGGGAAQTASSGKTDGSPATKVNHFFTTVHVIIQEDQASWDRTWFPHGLRGSNREDPCGARGPAGHSWQQPCRSSAKRVVAQRPAERSIGRKVGDGASAADPWRAWRYRRARNGGLRLLISKVIDPVIYTVIDPPYGMVI